MSDTCTVTVPAPSYSLAFSQDTYTVTLFDSADVSCTLKNGDTPMSGETVTLTYLNFGMQESVTVTTNANGVGTHTFTQFDIDTYPATITASYNGVTATCTIVDEL